MAKYKSKNILQILSLTVVFSLTLFSNSLIYKFNLENLHETNIDLDDLKVSGPEINITTPENKTYYGPMSGYYPATYGFENDEIGGDLAGWVTGESGAQIEVIGEIDEHKKIVRLDEGTGAEGWDGITHYPSTPLKNGTIEFYWRFDSLENEVYCNSRDEVGGTQGFVFGVFTDYDWRHYVSGTYNDIPNVGTPQANHWYHIKIDFRCPGAPEYLGLSEGRYNVTIDGINSGELSFSDETGSTDLYHFWLGTGDDCANAIVYYDAIGFSWDANYNIGDNPNEGLSLSYDIGFTPDWQGYSLDWQVNKTIMGNTTIPLPNEGVHTIQVFGNDSFSKIYESDIRYFYIDTNPPEILINSPNPNEFFGNDAPSFNISINEFNLQYTWYSLNSGVNITFSGFIGIINQTEWDKLANGNVTIRFYANDTWGFESYTAITIRKETVPPISLISYIPYGGMNFVNISTTFTINADDGTGSGVSSIRYKINDSTWIEYTGPFDLSSYPYGEYNITYQSIDNVGNVEDEKSIIVRLVEIPSETPGITGYNVFIVISIFTLIIGVIIKKRSKL